MPTIKKSLEDLIKSAEPLLDSIVNMVEDIANEPIKVNTGEEVSYKVKYERLKDVAATRNLVFIEKIAELEKNKIILEAKTAELKAELKEIRDPLSKWREYDKCEKALKNRIAELLETLKQKDEVIAELMQDKANLKERLKSKKLLPGAVLMAKVVQLGANLKEKDEELFELQGTLNYQTRSHEAFKELMTEQKQEKDEVIAELVEDKATLVYKLDIANSSLKEGLFEKAKMMWCRRWLKRDKRAPLSGELTRESHLLRYCDTSLKEILGED